MADICPFFRHWWRLHKMPITVDISRLASIFFAFCLFFSSIQPKSDVLQPVISHKICHNTPHEKTNKFALFVKNFADGGLSLPTPGVCGGLGGCFPNSWYRHNKHYKTLRKLSVHTANKITKQRHGRRRTAPPQEVGSC